MNIYYMDGHEFREIFNYGIPTGYYVCTNIKCGYSLIGGEWRWCDPTAGLMYVVDKCPAPIGQKIKWRMRDNKEILFIRGPQSPSDDPDTHA